MSSGGAEPTASGFTLLELMIVVSILGILASIGIPQYVSALRTARVGKAKHELRTISNAVDSYTASHDGKLPLSLYQVGFGGKRDPWGVPYCYLNYADGTGDGLDWAIGAGLVDPSAFAPVAGGAGGGGGGVRGGGGGDGGDGAPVAPRIPKAQNPMMVGDQALGAGRVRTSLSPSDLDAIATGIGRDLTMLEKLAVESAITDSGVFSFFTAVDTEQTRRRDRYMFPLNTDYDLFSLGPDGRTATSLGEGVGLDDVIRANNGGFIGSASDY